MRAKNYEKKTVKFSPDGITQFFVNNNKNAYLVTQCLKNKSLFFFRNSSRTLIVTFSLRQKGCHYSGMCHYCEHIQYFLEIKYKIAKVNSLILQKFYKSRFTLLDRSEISILIVKFRCSPFS